MKKAKIETNSPQKATIALQIVPPGISYFLFNCFFLKIKLNQYNQQRIVNKHLNK